jgi:hypothetical protein
MVDDPANKYIEKFYMLAKLVEKTSKRIHYRKKMDKSCELLTRTVK